MTLQKRVARITSWQIGLFAMPMVVNVLRLMRPMQLSPDRAFGLTMFRSGFTALCLISIVVLEVRKRRLTRLRSTPPPPPKFDV